MPVVGRKLIILPNVSTLLFVVFRGRCCVCNFDIPRPVCCPGFPRSLKRKAPLFHPAIPEAHGHCIRFISSIIAAPWPSVVKPQLVACLHHSSHGCNSAKNTILIECVIYTTVDIIGWNAGAWLTTINTWRKGDWPVKCNIWDSERQKCRLRPWRVVNLQCFHKWPWRISRFERLIGIGFES